MVIDDDPLVALQVDRLLDRQFSQDSIVDVDDLILAKDFGCSQNSALDLVWNIFELDAPLFDRFLHLQLAKHGPDLLHALSWGELGLHQCISHAWALAHSIGNTIDDSELRWQVGKLAAHLDDEKWLLKVSDIKLVDPLIILSKRNLFIFVGELVS